MFLRDYRFVTTLLTPCYAGVNRAGAGATGTAAGSGPGRHHPGRRPPHPKRTGHSSSSRLPAHRRKRDIPAWQARKAGLEPLTRSLSRSLNWERVGVRVRLPPPSNSLPQGEGGLILFGALRTSFIDAHGSVSTPNPGFSGQLWIMAHHHVRTVTARRRCCQGQWPVP